MGFEVNLKGKKAVIYGVANKNSIAWGVTKKLHEAGADIALTYYTERLKRSVSDLAEEIGAELVLECDARDDQQVEQVYKEIGDQWGNIDYIVHSVAFARREDLSGDYSDVDLEGFRTALEASAYSFIPTLRYAKPLFGESGGSAITMTFDASVKVYPGYNIMGTAKAALENEVRQLANEFGPLGVRVNALSPGPVNTLAARGVAGFNTMRQIHRERAPLQRNITLDELGNAALFLLSDMGSGITGTILPVDGGFGILA